MNDNHMSAEKWKFYKDTMLNLQKMRQVSLQQESDRLYDLSSQKMKKSTSRKSFNNTCNSNTNRSSQNIKQNLNINYTKREKNDKMNTINMSADEETPNNSNGKMLLVCQGMKQNMQTNNQNNAKQKQNQSLGVKGQTQQQQVQRNKIPLPIGMGRIQPKLPLIGSRQQEKFEALKKQSSYQKFLEEEYGKGEKKQVRSASKKLNINSNNDLDIEDQDSNNNKNNHNASQSCNKLQDSTDMSSNDNIQSVQGKDRSVSYQQYNKNGNGLFTLQGKNCSLNVQNAGVQIYDKKNGKKEVTLKKQQLEMGDLDIQQENNYLQKSQEYVKKQNNQINKSLQKIQDIQNNSQNNVINGINGQKNYSSNSTGNSNNSNFNSTQGTATVQQLTKLGLILNDGSFENSNNNSNSKYKKKETKFEQELWQRIQNQQVQLQDCLEKTDKQQRVQDKKQIQQQQLQLQMQQQQQKQQQQLSQQQQIQQQLQLQQQQQQQYQQQSERQTIDQVQYYQIQNENDIQVMGNKIDQYEKPQNYHTLNNKSYVSQYKNIQSEEYYGKNYTKYMEIVKKQSSIENTKKERKRPVISKIKNGKKCVKKQGDNMMKSDRNFNKKGDNYGDFQSVQGCAPDIDDFFEDIQEGDLQGYFDGNEDDMDQISDYGIDEYVKDQCNKGK